MDNVYLVTIKASDGNHTGTLHVTVTVTDENEPPAFAEETAAHSIAENTAAGQNIGTPVPATDPDDGATLTYTLGIEDRCRVLRHRRHVRPVADQGRPGL